MGASSSHHVSNPHPFLNNIYSDHGTIHDLFLSYKTSIRHEAQREAAERIVKELCMLLQTDDVTYIPVIERDIKPETEGTNCASKLRQINRNIMQKCSQILKDLQDLESNLNSFHTHMNELLDLCEQHVSWEEKECLPRMQSQLEKEKLDEINVDYNRTKKLAPSKPILGGAELGGGAGLGSIAGAGYGTGTGAGANVGATKTYADIIQGPSGFASIPGCGPASSVPGSRDRSSEQYYYGSGNKALLLACREAGDQSKPERVQGEYGPRSSV